MTTITIGGLFGSGAHEIGLFVSVRLKLEYVNTSAIPHIAAHANATEEAVLAKETHLCTWKERLGHILVKTIEASGNHSGLPEAGYFPGFVDPAHHLSSPGDIRTRPHDIPDNEYFQAVEKTNRTFAALGNVALTLRGGAATLRGNSIIHVGVMTSWDKRVERVSRRLKIGRAGAADYLTARQKHRKKLYKHFLGTDQRDPEIYDFVIDTDRDSREIVVQKILELA
ncbi:MAG: cytidylate kinase-like family protein [Chloroflexi bacterium]|nr:cytidylate kinase-like family protein [Chloroflexota bacterium]